MLNCNQLVYGKEGFLSGSLTKERVEVRGSEECEMGGMACVEI